MKPAPGYGECLSIRMSRMNCDHKAARHGLSAIEVVVGLVILALIVTLGAPLLLRARAAARRTACRDRLRTLTLALHGYHGVYGQLPPAAFWATDVTSSLALHTSKRVDLVTRENWAQLLLPFADQATLAGKFDRSRPIGDPANAAARAIQLALTTCPDDPFNRHDNRHQFFPGGFDGSAVEFARGNYGLNGGTHDLQFEEPNTAFPKGDFAHLVMQAEPRVFQLWGNGVAGINKSFSISDFANGQSTLIALEEVRAGIHALDPRGVWALGQIGGSITWAHGVNGDNFAPNRQWDRADDILGCRALQDAVGKATLTDECMPCVDYVDVNQQATARSLHPGGVHAAFLDGAVRFINDSIDPGVWHVIHSRETPPGVLRDGFEQFLATTEFTSEATAPQPPTESAHKDDQGRSVQTDMISNSVGMTFVRIPAGEFIMGIADQGNGPNTPEGCPPHPVRITRPFFCGTHEVTRGEFAQLTVDTVPDTAADPESTDFWPPGSEEKLPVSAVTWEQAMDFCRRLSLRPEEQAAGRWYRLPSEAEWEYACRAGMSEPYRWQLQRTSVDISGEAAGILPALPIKPVGSYPPNPFGLFDMRGNVWEWTADWFDRDYYARSPIDDPRGPAQGFIKVVRGGDWRFVGEPCQIEYAMLPPWKANSMVGFRVICERGLP